jgi:hypothetical protein
MSDTRMMSPPFFITALIFFSVLLFFVDILSDWQFWALNLNFGIFNLFSVGTTIFARGWQLIQ